MAEFEAAYERELAPILVKHGLTPSSEPRRATAPDTFARLFEIESVSALPAAAEALKDDASWGTALQSLASHFSTDPSRFTDHDLFVYSAPVGSGRRAEGQGRGQFREYGGGTTVGLYQDLYGHLWCGLSAGVGWAVYTPDDGLVHPDVQAIC